MILSKRPYFTFSKLIGTVIFVLLLLAAMEISQQLRGLGVVFSTHTFWWQVILGSSFLAIIGLILVWSGKMEIYSRRFIIFIEKNFITNKFILGGLFLLTSLGFSVWVLKCGYIVLNGFRTRLFFFMLLSLLGMLLLFPFSPEKNKKFALVGAMLFHAAIFKALIYFFQGISTSPFSLSWSEGSRYYYGSLFFSDRIYGFEIPLSPLHPSRYILLAIPFIFKNLPIWIHRSWQVILWIGLPALTGLALARRSRIHNKVVLVMFLAWAYLFINLGPVYYHLLVSVVLVFFGVNFRKPGQTIAVLIFASIWAGLSRINWVPVPIFLVLTLYFLEVPWKREKQGWEYWLKPIPWGIGFLVAFIAYFSYIPLSGNQAGKFGSTFTSDLLWYRLLPNTTYPLGILLGALIVTLPLWLVIFIRFQQKSRRVQPVKVLGYSLMILTLFLGGLVVSVKIGGGSNLHNMDAYFILLMTIGSALFWRPMGDVHSSSVVAHSLNIPSWILTIAILIPVLFILREGGVVSSPDLQNDQEDLSKLQTQITEVASTGGEILFISERQLQVFDLVPTVPIVPEYEKLILMEMAMAGNENYLSKFYKDITSQRFDLILTDSVRADQKDDIDPFSEEHNIWVERVIIPLLESYEFQALGGRSSIFLLAPR